MVYLTFHLPEISTRTAGGGRGQPSHGHHDRCAPLDQGRSSLTAVSHHIHTDWANPPNRFSGHEGFNHAEKTWDRALYARVRVCHGPWTTRCPAGRVRISNWTQALVWTSRKGCPIGVRCSVDQCGQGRSETASSGSETTYPGQGSQV